MAYLNIVTEDISFQKIAVLQKCFCDIPLVGLAQFQGHGDLVVEVSKGAIQVEGVGVQDGLGGLLNFGFLRIGEGS